MLWLSCNRKHHGYEDIKFRLHNDLIPRQPVCLAFDVNALLVGSESHYNVVWCCIGNTNMCTTHGSFYDNYYIRRAWEWIHAGIPSSYVGVRALCKQVIMNVNTINRWPAQKAYTFPYPEPMVIQWQCSGNPVCLELRPQCILECHWRENCW